MRALLLAVPALGLAADPITLVVPQTLHQPVGATTALRSGASAAIGDEAAATWYDPAIAAVLDPDQLSAGATAYGFSRIDLRAGEDSDALLSGAVLKVYGGLSGRSPDGSTGWALMFANPLHWSGAVDNGRSEAVPGLRSYGSHVRVSQDSWAAQAAVAAQPVAGLQVGVAAVGNYDSIDLAQALWVRDADGRYSSGSLVTAAWSVSVQGRLGLRLDPGAGPVLALSITTPGVETVHGGDAIQSSSQTDPVAGTSDSADARAAGDAFRFVHPWQVILAGGWRADGWNAELDLVWSLPEPTHETLPELTGSTISSAGGSTVAAPLAIEPRYTRYRHVLNARAGGSVRLGDSTQLHLGAFTDLSPIASSDIYNEIDLYGASVGLSLRRGDGAIVLGASATYGSENISIYDPAGDRTVDARLRFFSMDFLIGTVAKF